MTESDAEACAADNRQDPPGGRTRGPQASAPHSIRTTAVGRAGAGPQGAWSEAPVRGEGPRPPGGEPPRWVVSFLDYLRSNSTHTGEVRPECAMSEWLNQVGVLTAVHRNVRADHFAKLARRRFWRVREQGHSDQRATQDSRWHRDRERGQRERIERVARCGAESLHLACVGCGMVHEQRSGCRVGLLCVPCRSALAASKRRAFVRAREVAVYGALTRGLFNPFRRGGRWSEKFLTLTLPHFRHQSIAERIRVVCEAWQRFLRKLNRFWKETDVRSAEWLRVLEWTPGDDERGHPHFHLWILSPFLPRETVERWWREALMETTHEPVAKVIIDIREVQGNAAERELIKYLTKDITANGKKLAPELYAQVYKALDGRRNTQASRGFMAKAEREKQRCECGCALPKRVQRIRKRAEEPQP
jgi:hypothetical protein